MSASLRIVLEAAVLASPVALGLWFGLRKRGRIWPDLGPGLHLAAVVTGAAIAQASGLALFAAITYAQASGEVDFVNGVVGYGTVLVSPWAGIGAWAVGSRVGTQGARSGRALVMAFVFAVGGVLTFFGAAAIVKFDGGGWMVPYALAPIIGASIGYRLGAFGFRTPVMR